MTRTCRRNTCHRPAVASLTFRYDAAEVRLDDLVEEPHPQRWDVCAGHAATLTVPLGWTFLDGRAVPTREDPRQLTVVDGGRQAVAAAGAEPSPFPRAQASTLE